MRCLCMIIIMATSLASMTPASEKALDLSGVWILDPGHNDIRHTSKSLPKLNSTIGIGGVSTQSRDVDDRDVYQSELPEARIQNLTLTITQTNDEVQTMRQFLLDGEIRSVAQKFLLNSSQCINVASSGQGEFVSRTRWKNNKLINSGTQTTAMGGRATEISVEEEYSISKDGKKLTIETSFVTSRGVTHLKQVFKKE